MQTRIFHILLLCSALLAWDLAHGALCSPNIQKIRALKEAAGNSQKINLIFPVLLVEFEDVKFSVEDPKNSFKEMLNKAGYSRNGASGSAAEYFNDNFKDKYAFSFMVSDIITLPSPISFYGAGTSISKDTDVRKMVADACSAAMDSSFNFSGCSMDAEGIIGNISIIYAGHSEAEGGNPESIWPHQMDLGNSPITVGEYRISSYTCTAELWGAEGNTIAPIGPFCHEFSHYLGLPDLYDTNGENEGLSPALYGSLSIMDNGHFLNSGNTPPYFNSIEREILGIGEIEDLVPDSSYTIPPLHENGKVYRIESGTDGEYFLLEYRKRFKWDTYIGGEGLIVYHIDKSDNEHGGLASSDRWIYNNINSFSSHECARVLPAAGSGSGISGIFFPGSSKVDELLSFRGNTLLQDWSGHAVGIGLRNITLQNGKLTFKTILDFCFNDTLPLAVDCKIKPYQEDARIEWRDIEPAKPKSTGQLQWLITLEKEGTEERRSLITDSTCCLIDRLVPGSGYTVEIRAIMGREFGEPHTLQFRTYPVSSPYPYIFIRKDDFEIGNVADLRIFNLPEDAIYTDWYINGKRLSSPQIKLDKKGNLEIVAGIGYKDGTYEKITKTLSIF